MATERKKEAKRIDLSSNKAILIVYALVFLVILLAIFYSFFGVKHATTLIQKIGLEFSEPQDYNWEPTLKGELKSVRITGKIRGEGRVKAYFGNLLILDSARLNVKNGLTGNVVDEAAISDNSQEESIGGQEGGLADETASNENIEESENGQGLPEVNGSNEEPVSNTGEQINESTNNQPELPVTEFEDVCEQTCNMIGVNNSSYNLRIELDNSTLEIDEIEYQVVENATAQNIAEANESRNFLGNLSAAEENLSVANISAKEAVKNAVIETVQYKAVIGKPVKWKKTIDPETEGKLNVELPKEAERVTVKKIEDGKESLAEASITGYSIAGFNKNSVIGAILSFINRLFLRTGITGHAIEEGLNLEVQVDQAQADYEVVYETPAPEAFEKEISDTAKKITVSGPENIHYQDVLAFTELPAETSPERIHLYYLDGAVKEEIPVDKYDNNNNGFIDYVEWVVPSLSNKTYELIIQITKAEHLDENRSLVRDIYNQVKKQDNIWSEAIPPGNYVRVSFEQNLTRTNDITVYARTNGTAQIEVYAKDSDELITAFSNFSGEGRYKVLLSNLGEGIFYETFDLKIIGAEVELDYIVDPSYECEGVVWGCNLFDGNEAGCGATTLDPQYGCYWSSGTSTCLGQAELCIVQSSIGECQNQIACSWLHTSCDNPYISCPATATVGVQFNITYGAYNQSNPSSLYPTTSLRVFFNNTLPSSQLVCNEFTSTGDQKPTGNKTLNITETTAGIKNYTVYAAGVDSSKCNQAMGSAASCTVNVQAASDSNITLKTGWNSFALVMGTTSSGDRVIQLNNTWNLIGFSANASLNLSLANFTNMSGSIVNWSTAVSQGKLQAYAQYVVGGKTKYAATADLGADDYAFENATGYFIKANQRGNLTLPGVGGTTAGTTFNFVDLKFSNGTEERNWSAARDENWTFISGAAVIYFYNETNGDYGIVCDIAPPTCVQTTLEAWRGYYIWSNKGNIVMIRRG